MIPNHRPCACLLLLWFFATSPAPADPLECMPIYGNWCGIGHPRPGTFPPPIDAFDNACKRHDLCIAGPGRERDCDLQFVAELHGLARRLGSLPRPLQWAEYVIRVKAGGSLDNMPTPTPEDTVGLAASLLGPCP
jgi:hypothetical protein